MFDGRHRDTGEVGQLAAIFVVLDSGTHQRAAAVDPQQRRRAVGKPGGTMQADRDVVVDCGNLDAADPARASHQLDEFALEFETTMQGVPARQEAGKLAQIGIQRLS